MEGEAVAGSVPLQEMCETENTHKSAISHFPSYIYFSGMLVPTSARVYRFNVGMVCLKVLNANVGFMLLLKY